MADKTIRDLEHGHNELLVDMGDGTYAARAVLLKNPSLPPEVATVRLSDEDRALLASAKNGLTTVQGAYVPGTARAPGRGILASITTAGTAILTFDGVDIPFNLSIGPTILSMAVTKVTLPANGAAVGNFFAVS